MPPAVKEVADRVARTPGLVGVFWGSPLAGGPGPELVVHAGRSRPGMRGVESVADVGSWPVGVSLQEVPQAGQQLRFDSTVPVHGDDSSRGRSAATAIALVDGVPLVLVSGHGTLPLVGGALPGIYDPKVPAGVRMTAGGRDLTGTLILGRLDPTVDFGLARMRGQANDVSLRHEGAERVAPLVVRASPIARDERVRHYSAIQGTRREGRVRQLSHGQVALPGVGGKTYRYRDVFAVSGGNPAAPFSVPGDSGSLVVDESKRAIGMIVGGDPSQDVSYVLPVSALVAVLRSAAQPFFIKESA
jgi:hypothetical protein